MTARVLAFPSSYRPDLKPAVPDEGGLRVNFRDPEAMMDALAEIVLELAQRTHTLDMYDAEVVGVLFPIIAKRVQEMSCGNPEGSAA